jgi:hypothetical protein
MPHGDELKLPAMRRRRSGTRIVMIYPDGMAVVLENLQLFSMVYSCKRGQHSTSTGSQRFLGYCRPQLHLSAISIGDKIHPHF